MEVLGVISAIPNLIQLARGTAELLQACASNSAIVEATKGLDVQLSLLVEVLTGIACRWKAKTIHPHRLALLQSVLTELHAEIATLNELLAQAKGSIRLFQRLKLTVTGCRGFWRGNLKDLSRWQGSWLICG